MNIVYEVEKYVKEQIEEYKNNSIDHYDFWNEHIKYVYEESIKLAQKYNADIEIVSLGALLHDISLIKGGTKENHHIEGSKIAKTILEKYNYSKEKIDRVVNCIYNHRNSKNATNIEEICVCDADILAHFDNITIKGTKDQIKSSLEKDYNDLSDITKESFKDKYKEICEKILKE